MPRGRMLIWALLIPLAYAPAFLLGSHPGPAGLVALGLALAVALAAVAAFSRGASLDRAAAALDPLAVPVLLVALAAYVGLSSVVALRRVAEFDHAPMLGLFSQSCWTQLRGHPFSNTQESIDGTLGSHFAIHFSPALFVLTPFYALFPKPAVLVVAQALALALAAIPLYHLLRPRVARGPAALFAASLLAVPIFAWGACRDFHDSSFLPAPLLAAVWALERGRWRWFAAFALLALCVREDAGLVLAALGVWALVRGLGPRVAIPVAVAGLLWSAAITRLVMPAFWSPGMIMDPRRFFVAMFGQWGATPLEAVRGILTHPAAVVRALTGRDAVHYLYLVFQPLLLLPPFGDWAALVALPGLGVNLLSRYAFMRAADLPYTMIPVTFLALAAVQCAVRVAARAPEARRGAAQLALALIVLSGTLPALAMSRPRPGPNLPPRAAAQAVVRAVPAGAPVYAPLALYPALCNREDFDAWESTGPLTLDREFRRRYRMVILWPDGDLPGQPRDRMMADSLARDPAFARRPGFEPFVVYERR